MNSIWSVKETENDGNVQFKKPSTVSEQVDFTLMMMNMSDTSAVDLFNAAAEGSTLSVDQPLLPTRQNVEEISAYMEDQINDAFKRAGISTDEAVTFTVGSDGSLKVTGDRDDIGEIQELFENNTDLSDKMKTFIGLASEMPKFERAIEFQIKYENADSKKEIDALLKEYADLFDGKEHYDSTFAFDSGKMDIETTFTA
ncbi:hypothetical protein [Seleniivibrio sp.]|uniref:hypothetical protein n=1 Tax=Seleniivibrio sp. TaxID=2898801 RepID=UPI0025E62F03|nr:hypothetical protein [Seleniivibrio sp.]MCD8553659.1 hypothetical protein [Seleniivibrio sp.]